MNILKNQYLKPYLSSFNHLITSFNSVLSLESQLCLIQSVHSLISKISLQNQEILLLGQQL